MNGRTLTDTERQHLSEVLNRDGLVRVLVHGDGTDQFISFYAIGTRLEARIKAEE